MNRAYIRAGRKDDLPAVLDLIKELAVYEREPNAVEVSLAEMERDGFGEAPAYAFLVAWVDEKVVGTALYYFRYSTWKGKCLYLEDLIVTEAYRGQGIGHQLFEALMGLTYKEGYHHMTWQVLDWNEPAIKFYRKYPSTFDASWVNGRIDRKAIGKWLNTAE